MAGGIMASNQPTFTGFEPEIQDISRQREMAKLLLQKGMADNMQGQMVSGRYVGASPLQGIANMYAAYTGRQLAKESDRKQAELAEKLRQVQSTEAQDILGALRGTPEQTVYGAGMEGPTMNVTPAVEGSQSAALAQALKGQSPFSQTMAAKLMEQQFKEPKWEKVERLDPRTGNTIAGMVNVNSPQPENTFREIGVSKPALSAKDIAQLRDEGIAIPSGGGMSVGGVSMGGGQGGGMQVSGGQGGAMPKQDQRFAPSTLPSYEYNPSLSPKQNRELEGKFSEDLQKNVKNAKNTFELLKDASTILNTGKPSSGRLENIVTGTREFFGGGGETSEKDQQLNMIGGALTMTQPRFEGPQGVLDVKLYEKLAGDLGNANLPIQTRVAAVQQMIKLQKKYYPNGEWDKIDIGGPVRTKQTFFSGSKTMSPTDFRKGLTGPDQEAFDWARRNPNDPRSTEIRNRLGF